ncbi:lipid-binding SYLF domain-containing protein [Geminisphaera colitermitum]|uniref:lipid-binding SYLF domain-containing protein n=1 Tax=Geminisphaera colitermitum TaxID=1148786 RepID=UPI0005BDE2BE|nr:lipid-binding SYLF domain-containing protein [Geminisphaera colitermitum]
MKRLGILFACFAILASAVCAETSRKTLVTRFESCEAIIREFQANAETQIPAEVLKQAKGIIITNQVKGGFIFGMRYGYGVVLVRQADGSWSIPVLIRAGETSLGLQIGGNTIETVYIITDAQTPKLLFADRLNIGVDANAVYGPRAADVEKLNRELLNTPVLVYAKGKGLYAGATVKTGWISRNDEDNFTFYQTQNALPELLYSNWVQPPAEVQPLINYIGEITK